MDRMAEIQTFVQVAEAGGIGAAAERLGVAKSAVSRRLKDLEERLGVRLVNRTTRQLSLTDTGKSYYQRAAQIINDLDEADQEAAAVHGRLSGKLRLAAPVSFGVMHLAPAISSFLELHTDVWIDVDLDDRRVDLVDEGFDVAVRIGQLEDSSLIARRLAIVRNVMCASPDYLAAKGVPQRPEDLSRHAFLRYSNVPERRVLTWTDDHGQEHFVTPNVRLAANNGEMIVAAGECGLGILSQPTFLVWKSIMEGRLVPILTHIDWWKLGAYALYPPGRHLSAKVRAFVDYLAGFYGEPPYWDACLSAEPQPAPRAAGLV
jgi:DNA-binding transcriptional LysR family regulator